ncbi:MAG: AMP-binding protein, partial [Proteobacteria bacterium]|nr:AMP-binding protein [Pseudomonadota bacterium]
MEHHPERYEAHLAGFRRTAEVRGRDEYEAMYQRSLDEPERFWAEQARRYLTWDRPWDFVLRADFEEARFEWFGGGVLNASANCLDRHLPALADKTAYYWEGDEPGRSDRVTYGQLHRRVNKLAALLKSRGLGRGDRVVIYMPMIVELPTALLACARIGAIHCVVFGGLGAAALADRIRDCGARAVITADAASRGGRPIPLKNIVDQALEDCEGVETVIVHDHRGSNPALKTGRDLWWHQAAAEPGLPDFVPPEPMDAEDPLFILHTSGSTGKPKGLVHTHGGYLVHTAMSARLVFDLQPEDVFWCTGNLDWITGHSYGVYGPLLNGLTMVLYEGLPDFPGPDRFWRIAEHYRVSSLYTMPTTIRGWAREG